jgi:hypothetical protein
MNILRISKQAYQNFVLLLDTYTEKLMQLHIERTDGQQKHMF